MAKHKPSEKTAKRPRVGIFMPAYNQGPYIHEAINSLEKQTFQDFEVIIADDCSTDGVTPGILRKIDYKKARVVFNKKNRGISKQTSRFSKMLKNEYFFILCADDKIHPEFIERCVDFLDNSPNHAAVASWIQCFGESEKIIKVSESQTKLPEMLIENNFLGSAMTRRKALEDIDYSETRPAFKKHYDYDRWVSILEKGWSLGVVKKPLFYYRILSSSLSKSINVDDELKFRRAFVEKHTSLFQQHAQYLVLHYQDEQNKNKNWQTELREGRDWLEKEYHRLLGENRSLSRTLDKVNSMPAVILHQSAKKLLSKIGLWNKKPKLYAIFAFRYDHALVPGLLKNLEGIIDGHIAHDDRSNTSLWYHEGKIRNGLIEKARKAGADWVLCIDPDERFEIGAGKKIRKLIKTHDKKVFQFNFRELWTPTAYRSDGIWNDKKRPNLFPLLNGQEFMNKRVHSVWHPQNSDYEIVDSDINLYRLKNIDPKARTDRKNLYNKLDPTKKFQSIGYDYLDNEDELELTEIPKNRLYTPEYDPSIKITQTGE